jgi:hypothetical protein
MAVIPPAVFPSPLKEIDEIVESSRSILDLRHDWDGEGASPIAESTWRRAVEFLRGAAYTLWTKHNLQMKSPSIVPVADGSIDLHWKVSDRELLVNIPVTEDEWASYYGDNRSGGNTVEGKLSTHPPVQWLFVWLTE